MRAYILAAALAVAAPSAWGQSDPETCPRPDDVAAFMADQFPEARKIGEFVKGDFLTEIWRADRATTDLWMAYETTPSGLCLILHIEADPRMSEAALADGEGA